ncbi:MAG: 1-acyl-sn-glycerol-3-phosphate acyltransferase [Spirochaetes bacterium]|nr:1-acyl-sn-glycerol-3-phosphate acyltransferase [Spirochaetota bacterium]
MLALLNFSIYQPLLMFILWILSFILWAAFWVVFTISIFLLIILSLFIKERALDLFVHLTCKIATYSVLIFPKVRYLSPQKLPYPVIYTANHVSFFDLFISGTALPGYPRGFEMQSHFRKPIYGWFISLFGQIPLDSSSKAGIRKSFQKGIDILNQKRRNLFFMPEGSRSRTGELLHFKTGAFYLSRKSGYPIVPVVYKNLYQLNNATSLMIRPGILEVLIGDPIYPNQFKSDIEMSRYTRDIMNKMLADSYKND